MALKTKQTVKKHLRCADWLKKALYWQGALVAQRPLMFLLGPLILTTVLSYGFVFRERLTEHQSSLEYYIPNTGLYKRSREMITEFFNDTYLSSLDILSGMTFSVILHRKDRNNIFDAAFISDYLWLRESVKALTVNQGSRIYSYSGLCLKHPLWNNCYPDLFELITIGGVEGYRDVQQLTYPKARVRNPLSEGTVVFDLSFAVGGVEMLSQNYLVSAKAAMMNFHFPYPKSTAELDSMTSWEDAFRDLLNKWQLYARTKNLDVSWFTMRAFEEDFREIVLLAIRLLPYLLVVLLIFSVTCCCVADWVFSKPLLGIAGVISPGIAVISGFGFLMICQVPFVNITYISPFLVMSISVNDMFITLAAWRQTDINLPVKERVAQTFSDAAVSISITRLTDAFSFAVGAICTIAAVRYFCIYSAVAIVFGYIYQLTFFGACMAYAGQAEAENRHCFVYKKLLTSRQAERENKGLWYYIFCTGGIDRTMPDIPSVSSSLDTPKSRQLCTVRPTTGGLLNFICKNYYAPLFTKGWFKVIAALSYCAYMAIAVFGCARTTVGLDYAKLLPDLSITHQYLNNFGEHFTQHSLPLEVLVADPLDYSDAYVQRAVLGLASKLQNTAFTGSASIWLQEYLEYLAQRGIQVRHAKDFITVLYGSFLNNTKYSHFKDQLFWPQANRFGQTRFFVDVKSVHYGLEKTFMDGVQKILDTANFNVTAYHRTFQLAEQQAAILPNILQSVGISTATMLVFSSILIGKPIYAMCVALCVVSINLGVIGFMSLWEISLDIISMITLLMSIGISVDIVSHICYCFAQGEVHGAQGVISQLGQPVLQGAFSTLAGMAVLLAIKAYTIRAFVKTMLLVVLFGLYHGLVLLPLLFPMIINDKKQQKKPPNRNTGSIVPQAPSFITATPEDYKELANTSSESLPTTKDDQPKTKKHYVHKNLTAASSVVGKNDVTMFPPINKKSKIAPVFVDTKLWPVPVKKTDAHADKARRHWINPEGQMTQSTRKLEVQRWVENI